MGWCELIVRLRNDSEYSANKELAALIVNNDPQAVHYYLTEIGMPIMTYIERSIMHRDISAEYYIFLSSPFNENIGKPEWHKVALYKGIDCLLSSYTSCIASRYFCKLANKENKVKEKEGELLDFVDYESLLKCENTENDEDNIQTKCIRQAYSQLSERDRMALRYLVIEKQSSIEAFPLLSPYIKPRPQEGLTSDEIKQKWTIKQKQDAMSLMKGRALTHLQKKYMMIKKENYEKC